jgi:ketosteroid isomerase-like protein
MELKEKVKMESSIELRNIVFRYYEAVSRGDSAVMEHLISYEEGAIGIGSDPNECWEGYENIVHIYKTQIEEIGKLRLIADDPQAYCEGSVGWAMDRPRFSLPDGKEIQARFTVVFHREHGDWRIVQHHISIGVPNEVAIGRTLTVQP